MRYILAVLGLFVASAVAIRKVDFTDCGSTFNVSEVWVEPCDRDDYCPLYRGTNVTMNITFVADDPVEKIKAIVHGVIGGIPLPFPLNNAKACTHNGMSCPLVEGNTYSYQHYVEVATYYPKLSVGVRWQLRGKRIKPTTKKIRQSPLVCVVFPCKIMDPPAET